MTPTDDVMPFLLAAMDWRDQGEWDAARVLNNPDVAHYVTDWMRGGDAGVIAEVADVTAGAAWWRHFTSDDPGYGFVADDVPEVGMAVLAPYRGRGIGAALLDALIELARATGIRALSLSVEEGNGVARALYERRGFEPVARVGDSDTMVLSLRDS